jgi:hypothetical protein
MMPLKKLFYLISFLLIIIACDQESLTSIHDIENPLPDNYYDSLRLQEHINGIRTFPEQVHGKIDTLVYNGDSLVNFVWIAWDSTDLDLSKEMLQDFFTRIEPFATYKDLFNSFIVYHKLVDGYTEYSPYISENPIIELMQNDSTHNFFLVASAINLGQAHTEFRLARFKRNHLVIMAHELGHLFGLGDEYLDEISASVFGIDDFRIFNYPNIDTLADESKVKWSHFIGLAGYESVGVFEGAFFHEKGFYRPEMYSIMNLDGNSLEYNAPSREAIVKKIYEIVGVEYSFDDFLENDRK